MPRLEDVILRGTLASRPAANTVATGAIYYDTTNSLLYRSNGSSWDSISSASTLADGDYGDITVGSSGTTFTIDAGAVTEAKQTLADNTTNDVSTTKHGYAPKAPNDATKYLDGTGNYSVPASGDAEQKTPPFADGVEVTKFADRIINGSNITVTELADGEAVQIASTATGGGGLVLVEKKLVTSATQSVTFSGLDGNTDEVYLLMARIKNDDASAAVYKWQPNGADTNMSSTAFDEGGGSTTGGTGQLHPTTATVTQNWYYQFEIWIHAKKDPNSQSFILTYHGEGHVSAPGTGQGRKTANGFWNDTSTNLTSIVVTNDRASGIGNGSTLALYKYAQS